MTSPVHMIHFVVPSDLKDEIIDHLLSSESSSGFNISPIMGYSKKHSSYNIEELVRGYKEMLQFNVLIEDEQLNSFKSSLSHLLSTSKARYWVTPVIETGHL